MDIIEWINATNATIRWCKMDIDKKFFMDKYIHNLGTSDALVYFTLIRFANTKKNGKRCCQGKSREWLIATTRRTSSEINDALLKLRGYGLITIEHNYRPLSDTKAAIKRREKKGSDAQAYDINTYYIEEVNLKKIPVEIREYDEQDSVTQRRVGE